MKNKFNKLNEYNEQVKKRIIQIAKNLIEENQNLASVENQNLASVENQKSSDPSTLTFFSHPDGIGVHFLESKESDKVIQLKANNIEPEEALIKIAIPIAKL